ncbi:glycosyltransferase family 2 protein [Moraxella nasicaprae]|uniref:Glycosyltransferase n=1 Tax=Moraxella nasicaprae TaxID=2904122 RepID=A0ABY6F5B7_9GAMM|nr:glycosyltransferase [Moraxella nasicaprae]UXZ05280.1 glycosyltransferase [Moraxella nasicaprae]
MISQTPTVAVITSTIGRHDLERAILSVKNQHYQAKHYVFVDGEQFWVAAKSILDKYPEVVATYLPMNTGASGWSNSSINAIAPFLVKEDIVCYLDDDNWYEPSHVEQGVQALLASGADYAYAMRNLYDVNLNFLCPDTYESLGEYSSGWQTETLDVSFELNGQVFKDEYELSTKHHIDTNCYFFPTTLAKILAVAWHTGFHNDKNVYRFLNDLQKKGVCTRTFSVNYLFDAKKQMSGIFEEYQKSPVSATPEQAEEICHAIVRLMAKTSFEGWGNQMPWEIDGKKSS